MTFQAAIHWRKIRLVRRAVRRLPQFDIRWAVIAPSDEQQGGWDYHLIRAEWGYDTAVRYQQQLGGWILAL